MIRNYKGDGAVRRWRATLAGAVVRRKRDDFGRTVSKRCNRAPDVVAKTKKGAAG
ncbi:hypothetical protein QCE73_17095 [Caballeronia sp. LZ029]|uniref:hypothetical protein n=1 Tax=Caballeronia sp. LZ029 TaxID=3038564 RepID=UPI00285B4CBC|nr:hypothetical protein [Caballeronia sp. LZ029]MDR5744870.1 hypothetical protein [Caballeronia sp. LZ029]